MSQGIIPRNLRVVKILSRDLKPAGKERSNLIRIKTLNLLFRKLKVRAAYSVRLQVQVLAISTLTV